MADFSSILTAIPPVTRVILVGVGIVTGPCLLGIVPAFQTALLWYRVWRNWEIWRPITAFCFGGGGFPLIYDVFLIFRNSSSLEKDTYLNDTAQYAWTHVMLATYILLLNVPFGFPFLFRPLLHAQNYLWCRANATMKISIFGLLTIPSSLYPFALILLDLVTGGPSKALAGMLGLLSGHLWWFMSSYLPLYAPTQLRRKNPCAMPIRFRQLFPRQNPGSSATATSWGGVRVTNTSNPSVPTSRPGTSAAEGVRHRWGSGNRLGGSDL